MHVVIFEGLHWLRFAPLSLSRPVFMLATGMASLLEKQVRHTRPSRMTLWVRPELAEFVRRRVAPKLKVPVAVNAPLDAEPALLLSGRTLHFKAFDVPDVPAVLVDDGGSLGPLVRAALVRSPGLSPDDAMTRSDLWMRVLDLPRMKTQTRLVERLWDLIGWNEESLVEDFAQVSRPKREKPAGPYHVIEAENVWLGEGVRPGPGAVLDASKGPVVVDDHAVIGANAVLQGPCYVGHHAQVMPLSWIRAGTSIGPLCKVGGEVSNSIFFGYSNKSHEGFVGDSYIGKWVNLGAGTTTSNLKNTYGQVKVLTAEGEVNSGRQFLGALVGDHAKTAIGTRLMAGAYMGFCSMVASSGMSPRAVPSFVFHTDKGGEAYRMDKAVEVMKAVFARRNRSWDSIDDEIVRYVEGAAGQVEART